MLNRLTIGSDGERMSHRILTMYHGCISWPPRSDEAKGPFWKARATHLSPRASGTARPAHTNMRAVRGPLP
jgi:hypothetical protein